MTPLQAIRAIAALIPKEGDLPEWAKIAQKVSKDHEGLPYFPGEPDWFDDESAIAELLAADVLFSQPYPIHLPHVQPPQPSQARSSR